MRKKPTRKRPYFTMESAMTAILRDASGKMHHGILFDPPLGSHLAMSTDDRFLPKVNKFSQKFAKCDPCLIDTEVNIYLNPWTNFLLKTVNRKN